MVNKKSGLVKLLDLGVGKNITRVDQTRALSMQGMPIGTVMYMSPEQTDGEVSETSDIFSLGVTLYQFFLWQQRSRFFQKIFLMSLKELEVKILQICMKK